MGFNSLTDKIRRDPLGSAWFNQLLSNQRHNEDLSLTTHAADGAHNSLEVARAVGSILWTAATTTYSIDAGSSSVIASVSRTSAGVVVITLSAGFFVTPMVVRLTAMDTGGEALPYILNYTVDSATQITVRCFMLAALGGNSWSATDGSFAIAIHSAPYTATASTMSHPAFLTRGSTFDFAMWNTFVQNQATLRSRLLVGHTSAGVHNTREIARGWAKVTDLANVFTLGTNLNVSSITNVGPGICQLNLPASTYTTLMQVFAQADYSRSNSGLAQNLALICFPRSQITTAKVVAYVYGYAASTNTWARRFIDFSLSIHTAAA